MTCWRKPAHSCRFSGSQLQEATQCKLWRWVEPSFRVSQLWCLPGWLHLSNLSVLVCIMKLKFPPFRATVRITDHVNEMLNKGPGIELVLSKQFSCFPFHLSSLYPPSEVCICNRHKRHKCIRWGKALQGLLPGFCPLWKTHLGQPYSDIPPTCVLQLKTLWRWQRDLEKMAESVCINENNIKTLLYGDPCWILASNSCLSSLSTGELPSCGEAI